MLVGKPLTGIAEVLAKLLHGEGDGVAMCSAGIAAEGVARRAERERGMAVGMKRTEGLVAAHRETEPCGYGLDRELTEILNITIVHDY